jgi:hypothetical protein
MTSTATCASPTTATSNTITMTVNPLPEAPTSVSATPSTINLGDNTTLTYTGGSGSTFNWYTGSCEGTLAGTGNSLIVSPTSTTTYYGAWTNGCGTSSCQSVTVTVNGATTYTVSGYLKYSNTAQTAMNGVTINLKLAGVTVATTTTSATGYYEFTGIANGNYTVSPNVALTWGSVSSMDVTIYKKHIGSIALLTGLKLTSGDVNASGLPINSIDMTLILQRIATIISSFSAGNWAYSDNEVTVAGANVSKDIQTICYGDANTSYFGGTKDLQLINIQNNGVILVENGEYFEIPVLLNNTIEDLASITLSIPFNTNEFEITEVTMINNGNDMFYHINDGVLRIMYSTLNPTYFNQNDNLLIIKGYIKELNSETNISNEIYGEFGDFSDNVINNIEFLMPSLKPLNGINVNEISDEVFVYPNPANTYINIANVENSKIEIIDAVGKILISQQADKYSARINIENLTIGTYIIRISKNNSIVVKKFTVIK